MYDQFFALKRRPFSATPDPGCFFPSASARQALAQLQECARSAQGIGLLTAPAGMGKTLLCRRLAVSLSRDFTTVCVLHSNYATRRSLLQAILYELGVPYARMPEQELRLELATACRRACQATDGVVLIVDEAHLLSERLLEELRTLTNLAEKGRPFVRLVLSGQLSLEETLAAPPLSALNQRVAAHVTLEPLTRAESAEYIEYRLLMARTALRDVFTAEAVDLICQASDGLPRCLNQLCDHSLALAYTANQKPVTGAQVLEALDDLRQLPLHWNEPLPAPSPLEQLQRQSGVLLGQQAVERKSERASRAAAAQSTCIEVGAGLDEPQAAPRPPAAAHCLEVGFDLPPAVTEVGVVDASRSVAATADRKIERGSVDEQPPAAPSETATVRRATRRSQRSRTAASNAPLKEELIVDRYAWLDAGWAIPPASPVATQPVSPPPRLESRSGLSGSRAERQPERQPAVEGDALEDEISAAVLDVVRETRAAVAPRPTQTRATASSPPDDDAERDVRSFGVVSPESAPVEPVDSTAHMLHSAHGAGSTPHLKFAQLFSSMRRERKGA